MAKIAYTATFTNGRTLTRKSEREYGFAYAWTGTRSDGTATGGSGFSRTRDLAEKAISSESGWLCHPPKKPRVRSLAAVQWHARQAAAWKPGKIEFREVVATVRV